MIESLTTTSGLFQEKLHQENEQLKRQLDDQASESQKFIQDNLEAHRSQVEKLNKLEIEYKNLLNMSKSDQKSYTELKESHELKLAELSKLRVENESLSKKFSECASLHKLEMHEIRAEMDNVSSGMTSKLREVEKKAEISGRRCAELEAELKDSLAELSSLRSELGDLQDNFVSQKGEWKIKAAEEIANVSAKAAKFEIMYNDEVSKVVSMKEHLEKKIKEVKTEF